MPAPNLQLLSLLLSKFGKGQQHQQHPNANKDAAANRLKLSNQFMGTQTPDMQKMLQYLDYKFFNPGIAGRNDAPGPGSQYGFGGFYRGPDSQPHQEGSPNVGNYGFLGGGPGGPGLNNMNHQGSWIDMFGKGTGQDRPNERDAGGMNDFLHGGGGNLEGVGAGFGGSGSSGTYYE